MIDPINSLAFSMHSSKGVYALLLGSGISRAASIPTGWEITIELVRKVAALQGADCEPDPAAWYRDAMKREPDYAELLDAVAKMPAERQQLLRQYWEPTEDEREKGLKAPTKAHRAIAQLVKKGYIKVILTTNFDRLLEVALQNEGIQPIVLSAPDHINGALPLIHTPCTVIKIHGDYLDTRIRNTPAELAKYPEEFDRVLDRVFDEFGLIVAGWSADWDEALRAAITRAPTRRFSTYWTSRGEPSVKAGDLISRRAATLVKISDADSFFSALGEQVTALEDFDRPHPLSAELAVATLKRYLSEPKYRIAHADLVAKEVDRVKDAMVAPAFFLSAQDTSGQAVLARLRAYEAASETLVRMAAVAGWWGEGAQLQPWLAAFTKLASQGAYNGNLLWIELQRYPALLLFYSFGIAATAGEKWDAVAALFAAPVLQEHREELRAIDAVTPWCMFERGGVQAMRILPDREREYTPLQNHVEAFLLPVLANLFPTENAFHAAFDKFETLVALYFAAPLVETTNGYRAPLGSFCWRHESSKRILAALRENLAKAGDGSPYVQAGLVGRSAALGLKNLDGLEQFVQGLHWGFR